MAKKAKKVKEQEQEARQDLFALTERILLAGIGAAALAYDEAEAFVNRMVERGELARDEARGLLDKVAERQEHRLEGTRERMRESVTQVLDKLDVPTKHDIADLRERIDRLTQQVEILLEQRAKPASREPSTEE